MITQVKQIIEKEGNKPWKFVLSHDGEIYSTFNPDVRSGLAVDTWIEATIEVEKKGQYTNRYLNEWKAIETPKAGEAPLDMSEARDRRIAMESAYGSATTFYAGRDTPPKELAALARAIFRDIIAAGKGEAFEPKKEPTRDEH